MFVFQEQGQRYYGKLCECNDFSCPEYKGQLCGGKESVDYQNICNNHSHDECTIDILCPI